MTERWTLPRPARLVVLVSGTGTLLQALLDAEREHRYPRQTPSQNPAPPFTVVAVVADSATGAAAALTRAADAGVPTAVVAPTSTRPAPPTARADWDAALAAELRAHAPDLVVSAGFMRLLGPAVLAAFPGRIINTHPALLPSFPGLHGVRDALAHGVRVTGSTAHLVDAGTDTGPIIAQRAVPVLDDDDEQRLHERIKVAEREMLVDVVTRMAGSGWSVSGRKVSLG